MKKILLLLSVITLFSCSKENEPFEDQGRRLDPTEGNCFSVDLIAGQNYVAGTVEVCYDNGDITVTYNTIGDWVITDTHLYIGGCEEIPIGSNGNPKVGHFPYGEPQPEGTTSVSYTVNESEVGVSGCIAAHAVVYIPATGQEETAWGAGTPFGGSSWATYFQFDF